MGKKNHTFVENLREFYLEPLKGDATCRRQHIGERKTHVLVNSLSSF